METTFDITGKTISVPFEKNKILSASSSWVNRGSNDGAVKNFHVLGIPLPGLARDMKRKSISDIRLAAAATATATATTRKHDLNKTRALSSDYLNRLLAPTTSNGEIAKTVTRLGAEKVSYAVDTLPALAEVKEEVEDEFLKYLICSEREDVQFKLTPAYLIYIVARHRLLFPCQAVSVSASQTRFMEFLNKVANRFFIFTKQRRSRESLSFWLANSSELLNFFKQDMDLSLFSNGLPQEMLAACVENTFGMLAAVLKRSLDSSLDIVRDAFLDDQSASQNMVDVLEEIMCLLRYCRLNAALTIQIFSQLFYYVNMMLFNWLVSSFGMPYCSRAFGIRLRTRLAAVNEWAYQQGLELAAECHMDRLNQAITLLVTPKTIDQISNLGATCYKLNSVQVRWFLDHIVLDVGEEPVSNELVESIVRLAETHADAMATQDETPVQLEEEPELQLPFLLPQDGYSPDLIRGLPPALVEAINGFQARGLCRFFPQNHSSGSWTIYLKNASVFEEESKTTDFFCTSQGDKSVDSVVSKSETGRLSSNMHEHNHLFHNERSPISSMSSVSKPKRDLEIVTVTLNRGSSGIGLSIVAAQGIGERSMGIYVKKVVDGSAAHKDGRLECGDQLLSVNGQSLIGISQEDAASKMSFSGPIVSFEVCKQAARHNGLYQWLSNPPSSMQAEQRTATLDRRQSLIPGIVADNHVSVNGMNSQRFSRQSSATSTVSNFSNQPHLMKHGRNGAVNTRAFQGHSRDMVVPTTDQQPVKNRSVSISEIYENSTDPSLTVSLASLQPAVGNKAVPVQNGVNTTTSQRTSLPSHYRNIRPIVIQPSRPISSPTLRQQQYYNARSRSPSHLYITPSSSNQHLNMALKNPSSAELMSRASTSVITDYANLPLVDKHQSTYESYSPSAHSRSTLPNRHALSCNSNLCCGNQFQATDGNSASRKQNSLPSSSSQDSIRSASRTTRQERENEITLNECSEDSNCLTKKAPPVPPKRRTTASRREELNKCLDELESKGSEMTETDHQKYRELVNELAKIPVPFSIQPCSSQITSNRTMGDLEKVELDENGKTRAIGEGYVEENEDSSPNYENICRTQKKKCVQWNDTVGDTFERADASNNNVYEDDDDPPEPRAQVLGTQEVYRDPRQVRLIELKAKETAAQEAKVDGSKLGFRDKMQLFAEQIGGKARKSCYKASTLQREIEETVEDL